MFTFNTLHLVPGPFAKIFESDNFYQHNLLFSCGHRGGWLTLFGFIFHGQISEIKTEKVTALCKNMQLGYKILTKYAYAGFYLSFNLLHIMLISPLTDDC